MMTKELRVPYQLSLLQTMSTIMVMIPVPSEHPLLVLKKKLDWAAIKGVIKKHLREAGRNVDHGPGKPLNVDLYVPLLVLQLLKNLNSRQMEELLAENGPARVFIDWENDCTTQVRDHSNIARMMESLGEKGIKEVNALILNAAVQAGFADLSLLSGDTTAQELPIGYPHEAGILKGFAERCGRALEKLLKKGVSGLSQALDISKKIIKKAKEYHLFAKGKEAKEKILYEMVEGTQSLMAQIEKISSQASTNTNRVVKGSCAKLQEMVLVGKELLPQILQWLKTGVVAKGKIIHSGIKQARAIVRNKTGKKVEFGLQYLLGMIGGGYIFGELIEKKIGEAKMPKKCLSIFRDIFGKKQTPDMLIYDRGGWSKPNIKKLKKEGIRNVGIQPKGQADWAIGEQDQEIALSERGKMEGKIGTLKSQKYRFNKPKERMWCTLCAAGQKSIISVNLNKLMKDLVKQENQKVAIVQTQG